MDEEDLTAAAPETVSLDDEPAAEPAAPAASSAPTDPLAAEPAKPLPTLVFFIGGCTFAELAAVRWLGRHESPPREYIVATTHLCNGDDLVRSLVTSLENNLARL